MITHAKRKEVEHKCINNLRSPHMIPSHYCTLLFSISALLAFELYPYFIPFS